MTIGTSGGYGLGTGSSRARTLTPAAPHKSCTGTTLGLECPSPKRYAALLADDVTTSQIEDEKTTKLVQFDQPLSIFDRPMAQISRDYPFSRARKTRANLSNTFGKQFQRTPVQLPAFEFPGGQ
jgi:hypothetical protein